MHNYQCKNCQSTKIKCLDTDGFFFHLNKKLHRLSMFFRPCIGGGMSNALCYDNLENPFAQDRGILSNWMRTIDLTVHLKDNKLMTIIIQQQRVMRHDLHVLRIIVCKVLKDHIDPKTCNSTSNNSNWPFYRQPVIIAFQAMTFLSGIWLKSDCASTIRPLLAYALNIITQEPHFGKEFSGEKNWHPSNPNHKPEHIPHLSPASHQKILNPNTPHHFGYITH